MKKLATMGKQVLAMTGLALALGLMTAPRQASAEPPKYDRDRDLFCSHCGGSASGSLLYNRTGNYEKFSAVLEGVSSDCGTLTVNRIVNRVDKTRLEEGKAGGQILTLYFKDPPALGVQNSVLFVGTVLKDGYQQTYYGDIYHRVDKPSDCDAQRDVLDSSCGWAHKGGFYFSRAR